MFGISGGFDAIVGNPHNMRRQRSSFGQEENAYLVAINSTAILVTSPFPLATRFGLTIAMRLPFITVIVFGLAPKPLVRSS